MPWVRFLTDFDFSPPEKRGHVTIAYKAGQELLVRRVCADKAIKIGAAVKVSKPDDSGTAPGTPGL